MRGPRVLCVSHPGIGHVAPVLPVARALAGRSSDVRFAVAASFRPVIAKAGFASVAAGLDWSEAHTAATFPEIIGMSPLERGVFLLREVFADQAAHATAHDVAGIIRAWDPDLVLVTDYEYGGAVAAQAAGVRWAVVGISLPQVAAQMTRMVRDELGYLRSAYDLDPWTAAEPSLYLTHAPEPVVPARGGLSRARPPATARSGRPPGLPADRFVYLSLGTVFNDRMDVFAVVLAGLRELGVPVVATVGRDQDPAVLGPQPNHVLVTRYLPQQAVLARADLFVTHSPFYSAMTALGAGIPLLMVPLSADQPGHASHFSRLGVGVALRTPDLPRELLPEGVPLTSQAVSEAAAQLLANGPVRERAAEISSACAELPELEAAAGELLAGVGVGR